MASEQKQPVLPRPPAVEVPRDASYYASPLLELDLVSVVRANFHVPYFFCARGGVTGGVISSVVGMYCIATRLAGCDTGGAEEARGRGNSNAGLGREFCERVSARGVEVCTGSCTNRLTGGGSSLTKSTSQRIVWGGARARGGGDFFYFAC